MLKFIKEKFRARLKRKRKPPVDLNLISKYREFTKYNLDLEVHPRTVIHIPQRLPSEPPTGITYSFEPSGYTGDVESKYCVIATTWRHVNNYCHWTLSELPFLILAFSSNATEIGLPPEIANCSLPFQKRWIEILTMKHPDKRPFNINEIGYPKESLHPVNHDTSNSQEPIFNGLYKHYHHGRATPYLLNIVETYKFEFQPVPDTPKCFYISRSNRRLKNEYKVQQALRKIGFSIIRLEKLSLDEQVSLFSNADTIVGFHGAGFANTIFCNSNTRIIEIVDSDCVHPCYKDGIVIPGQKATRTYFHMIAHMKGLGYDTIESFDYFLNTEKLIKTINSEGDLSANQSN